MVGGLELAALYASQAVDGFEGVQRLILLDFSARFAPEDPGYLVGLHVMVIGHLQHYVILGNALVDFFAARGFVHRRTVVMQAGVLFMKLLGYVLIDQELDRRSLILLRQDANLLLRADLVHEQPTNFHSQASSFGYQVVFLFVV